MHLTHSSRDLLIEEIEDRRICKRVRVLLSGGVSRDSALFSGELCAVTITYQIQAVAGMGDHDGLKIAGVPETLLHSCRDRRVAARTVAAAERDVPVYIYNIATTRAHQSSMPLCEEL